jgi:hypothetical protein
MHHNITYNVELYLRYKNIFGDRVELWNTVINDTLSVCLNDMSVLLHSGGFCNNCTSKRCLHISVHFQTNAL